jgi:2-dehydropantoate 2-reductase
VRYLVIGAGAVGGSIGAELHRAGREVVLVARGAHLAALRAHGLRYVTPTESVTLPIPAVGGPGELDLRSDDVLLLAVKLQDAGSVLDQWARQPVGGGSGGEWARADTRLPVFCVQNGVAGERMALRRFDLVYGVTVMLPSAHLRPGLVANHSGTVAGILTLGRYPSGVDDTVTAVAADLVAAGFEAPVSEEVMRWKYAKLLANLGNAAEVVLGPLDDAATDVLERAAAEGRAAYAAAGIDFASPAEDARARENFRFAEIPDQPRPGGSSVQSVLRGTGSTECAYLSGEIALLGRLHGVPTPVNATLARLSDECAVGLREPGSLRPADVLALADA